MGKVLAGWLVAVGGLLGLHHDVVRVVWVMQPAGGMVRMVVAFKANGDVVPMGGV